MPDPNTHAQAFLMERRSIPAKMLERPAPVEAALAPILAAAARVPDHGKLEPWRFVVIGGAALPRVAAEAQARGEALALDADQTAKARGQFETSPLAVVVVASPKPAEKVPAIEQTLSAGAVCLGLVNAATAAGWGACWLTGWIAHDRIFRETVLGLATHEFVAGIVHIGTPRQIPPERPRPDVAALTTRIDA